MKNVIWIIPLAITVFLLNISSCNKETGSNTFTKHPVEAYIPYENRAAIKLDLKDGSQFLDKFPESMQLLYHFLDKNESKYELKELPVLVSNRVDISAISDDQVLILDKNTEQLLKLNLANNSYKKIAGKGRGPGDLYFAKELNVYQNKAYISMEAYQISVFDCDLYNCKYEDTIMTDFNNLSVTADYESIFVLGIKTFGYDQETDIKNARQNMIFKMDHSGETEVSFLPSYNFRGGMVRYEISRNGQVRYFPEFESVITTFDYLPYIFRHDDEGNFVAKYQVPDFIQQYYEYEERKDGWWRGRTLYDSNTRLSKLLQINDRWLLIQSREQRGIQFIADDRKFLGDEWYNYYLFDVHKEELYKIGSDKKVDIGTSRLIFPVNESLLINEDGSLKFIKNRISK